VNIEYHITTTKVYTDFTEICGNGLNYNYWGYDNGFRIWGVTSGCPSQVLTNNDPYYYYGFYSFPHSTA
jgi:hypothetical protein